MSTNTDNKYKNKKGEIKYYASYKTAWNACIRLNQEIENGQWLFEADLNGWFLEFHQD
jgi:hypothetical protein